MQKCLVTSFFMIALSGCVINQKTAADYYQWGSEADRAGNYQLAERDYERALINAQLGHSPDAGISATMYNLGRIKGYLCKYDEAEKLLTQALELEEKVTGLNGGITSMRLFELARLHFDRGQYEASLPFYSRGISIVKTLGVEKSEPIALANEMDDYSLALEKSGKKSDSTIIQQEADQLRQQYPGRKPEYVPVRYPQSCDK